MNGPGPYGPGAKSPRPCGPRPQVEAKLSKKSQNTLVTLTHYGNSILPTHSGKLKQDSEWGLLHERLADQDPEL